MRLAETGLGASAIARETHIPRSTIRDWLAGRTPRRTRSTCPRPDLEQLPLGSYAYLLGVYLGDGYIARCRATYHLRLTLDARYPRIIGAARSAVREVLPQRRVTVRGRPDQGCVDVTCYYRWWPIVFPQHGPGRKHERPIALESWQRHITEREPEAFVRGLMHSDGSRFVATARSRGRLYRYPRYAFSNRSRDIKRILCEHLDLLNVAWTKAGLSIQIARQDAVASLDGFVGPKR